MIRIVMNATPTPAPDEPENKPSPAHLAAALAETMRGPSLFELRLFGRLVSGKFGWSGPRRLADGSTVH